MGMLDEAYNMNYFYNWILGTIKTIFSARKRRWYSLNSMATVIFFMCPHFLYQSALLNKELSDNSSLCCNFFVSRYFVITFRIFSLFSLLILVFYHILKIHS